MLSIVRSRLSTFHPCHKPVRKNLIAPPLRAIETISPDFLDAYVSLICNPKSPCEPILPEYYTQVTILHKMNIIMLQNNVEGFERQIFRLLLLQDMDTLSKLLENIKAYQMAAYNINMISKLVGLSPPS